MLRVLMPIVFVNWCTVLRTVFHSVHGDIQIVRIGIHGWRIGSVKEHRLFLSSSCWFHGMDCFGVRRTVLHLVILCLYVLTLLHGVAEMSVDIDRKKQMIRLRVAKDGDSLSITRTYYRFLHAQLLK